MDRERLGEKQRVLKIKHIEIINDVEHHWAPTKNKRITTTQTKTHTETQNCRSVATNYLDGQRLESI